MLVFICKEIEIFLTCSYILVTISIGNCMATRLSNFEPIFFTEKDIEMLQDINSLVEEEVSVQNVYSGVPWYSNTGTYICTYNPPINFCAILLATLRHVVQNHRTGTTQ